MPRLHPPPLCRTIHTSPQLRRRRWTPLDGAWDFALDPAARSRRPAEVEWGRTIRVPFAPETEASGVGEAGFYKACWYRRRVAPPELKPGDRLHLHLGAVDWEACAWANDWVDAYTPVNEPVTTARFSGLYGVWYPHGRDDRAFVRSLIHQCRAVALAMAAVRAVRPGAKLIQTDNLGQVHAPPPLAYQAGFENERRWLTWDLLSGRVDRRHFLWKYLKESGATDAELGWFRDHPCPPDVIGVNYYVTSERYLDDRLEHYPPHLHGGNGRACYADTEAVRVLTAGGVGPELLLRQAWERYHRAVAVTEAHLGCTPDEQVRWLWDVWQAAAAARAAGADVRAVTAWAAFGAHDWDTLVTRDGSYEPGLFDARVEPPAPTPPAALVRDLAAGGPLRGAAPAAGPPGGRDSERVLRVVELPARGLSPEGAGV